ncbi:Wzz/FepE/Etk N-terminal domain-containing protein [candidate division KSB1 bacterium]
MHEEHQEENIFFYLKIIFKHKNLVAFTGAVFVIAALIYVFVVPPTFTSYVTILPTYESEQAGQLSYLRNIAGQFGLTQMPVKNISELFPEVIKSKKLIHEILQKKFYFQDDSLILLDIFKTQGEDLNTRLFYGYISLNEMISVSRDIRTSITKVEVSSKYPVLAADIATAIVKELDIYNRNQRTSKAKENREFIEKRLLETEDSLNVSDHRLTEFYDSNKGGYINAYQNSPELKMEEVKLLRDQKKWEEVYVTLVGEYEIAKIQEVRDTPLINILDDARVPVVKSAPKRALTVILSLIVGLNIGIILSFIHESRIKIREKGK